MYEKNHLYIAPAYSLHGFFNKIFLSITTQGSSKPFTEKQETKTDLTTTSPFLYLLTYDMHGAF